MIISSRGRGRSGRKPSPKPRPETDAPPKQKVARAPKAKPNDDVAKIEELTKKLLDLLPSHLRDLPGECSYIPGDSVAGASCSCKTVLQLFGNRSRVPNSLGGGFAVHARNYCFSHLYAVLTPDGRERLMASISRLTLTSVTSMAA